MIAFAQDDSNGKLTFVQVIFDDDPGIDGLDSARGAAVSPDGENVYIAALLDNSIATFARNATTGMLTQLQVLKDGIGGVDGLAGANAVTVSPDGDHVYVASRSEDAVAVFARSSVDGTLTFLQALKDGVGGVDGLDAVEAITISADGAHLYTAGENDDAVAVFARETDSNDPDYGELTFLQVLKDGVGGVDGLNGANGIAIAPDGGHVYAACERTTGGGDWGSIFARNPATGLLTFLQALKEEDFGPYTGCSGVGPENSGVAVSPDNASVYYANPFRSTVAWFSRNPATGLLTLLDAICDLNFGIDGLVGVAFATVRPDSDHVVVASPSGEHVVVLGEAAIFSDGFESGDLSAWSGAVP